MILLVYHRGSIFALFSSLFSFLFPLHSSLLFCPAFPSLLHLFLLSFFVPFLSAACKHLLSIYKIPYNVLDANGDGAYGRHKRNKGRSMENAIIKDIKNYLRERNNHWKDHSLSISTSEHQNLRLPVQEDGIILKYRK